MSSMDVTKPQLTESKEFVSIVIVKDWCLQCKSRYVAAARR